jgi:hypothetical protein
MRAFVLAHGGRHGAWCWELVIRELEARGHRALAVDLPLGDATAGGERYARALADAAAALEQPVSVVGHSVSGLAIPLVPELAPVEELVFLCSPLPVPGLSLWDQVRRDPDRDLFIAANLGPMLEARGELSPSDVHVAHAIDTYYHDVPDHLARWAVSRLRPQLAPVSDEPSPLRAWPEVPSRYVLGRRDRIVDPRWARREVPRRLGIEPIELDTGHSPFLAQPKALADVLLSVSSADRSGA